jgi:hypothetical protein
MIKGALLSLRWDSSSLSVSVSVLSRRIRPYPSRHSNNFPAIQERKRKVLVLSLCSTTVGHGMMIHSPAPPPPNSIHLTNTLTTTTTAHQTNIATTQQSTAQPNRPPSLRNNNETPHRHTPTPRHSHPARPSRPSSLRSLPSRLCTSRPSMLCCRWCCLGGRSHRTTSASGGLELQCGLWEMSSGLLGGGGHAGSLIIEDNDMGILLESRRVAMLLTCEMDLL